MTISRSTRPPSDPTRRDRPVPCAIPHLDGVGLDMQCRGGHDCPSGGGDLFDAVSSSPGLVLLLLINVARHSQRPLRLLALAQDVFRGGARGFDGLPSESLAGGLLEMLQGIRRTLDAAASVYFATALLAAYEPPSGALTWISAGAPAVLLKDGSKVEVVEDQGPALALPAPSPAASRPSHAARTVALPPGGAAMLLTTGLLNAKSQGATFGMARAFAAASALRTGDPQEMCRGMVEAAIRFEQQPSRFGPPLRIPGFREAQEQDMMAVALVRGG